MWLYLTVPWVSLQCVVVVFPDHNHLLFIRSFNISYGGWGIIHKKDCLLKKVNYFL